MGLRLSWLGTEVLRWRDLLVIVKQSPHGSAIHRSLDPEGAEWDLAAYLLANISDATEWLQWAKTEDGSKNQNIPRPLPRPGAKAQPVKGIPIAEAAKALGWDTTTTEAGGE